MFPKPYADVVQRLRVAAGFVLLLAFALFAYPSAETMLAGLPISLFGLGVRAWAAGHLAKNEQLATTGPYAFVRNPLYNGTLLVALGIVIACRSLALSVIFLAVFALVYLPVIELEEQHLRKLFPNYSVYASRVHRFLPLSRWKGREGQFSAGLYMKNQEYKAALGFAIALLWMGFKCWLATTVR